MCNEGWLLIRTTCWYVPAVSVVVVATSAAMGWIVGFGTQEYRDRQARKRRDEHLGRIREQLLEVAKWRAKGVALRNDGCRIRNAAQEAAWFRKVDYWRGRAMKAVERLSPVDAERIRTLDLVVAMPPAPCRIRPNPRHLQELGMLTQETGLLNEFILYWGPYVTGASPLPPQA